MAKKKVEGLPKIGKKDGDGGPTRAENPETSISAVATEEEIDGSASCGGWRVRFRENRIGRRERMKAKLKVRASLWPGAANLRLGPDGTARVPASGPPCR